MSTNSEFWVMRPFNTLFCLTAAAFLLLLIVASLLLRGKSERAKQTVLVAACCVTLIGYFIYKHMLSLDEDYNRITAVMGGFNWWGELPLQLCNINMLLIPLAVLKRWRPLLSFCFFIAPLGALMALIMPSNGFDGYSILLPRMIGYYFTHYMIFIEGLAIAALGLFRPRFRDLPVTVLALLVIALIIFGVNLLLRATGLHPKANYFFSVETEGNPLLELFHRWLPFPFLYLLPSAGIVAVYAGVIILGFQIADVLRGKRKEAK